MGVGVGGGAVGAGDVSEDEFISACFIMLFLALFALLVVAVINVFLMTGLR